VQKTLPVIDFNLYPWKSKLSGYYV